MAGACGFMLAARWAKAARRRIEETRPCGIDHEIALNRRYVRLGRFVRLAEEAGLAFGRGEVNAACRARGELPMWPDSWTMPPDCGAA